MLRIALEATPNQSFTVTLDGVLYAIAVQETEGCMSVTIERAGVPVVTGQRAAANQPLFPFVSLESVYGNFAIVTDAGDLPYWDKFGVSQFLIFATTAEIGAFRNA